EFPVPQGSDPWRITTGPDGNLWFTEPGSSRIGRITPSGAFTELLLPIANGVPYGITAGPDGNVWFPEFGGNKIGRLAPSGPRLPGIFNVTEFSLSPGHSRPMAITAGSDGNLWFTGSGGAGGRISPTGADALFQFLSSQFGNTSGITAGPDG